MVLTIRMNKIAETRPRVSSNCSTPFNERTGPEIPIMFSPDQMPAKVEQLTNSGMGAEVLYTRGDSKRARMYFPEGI
jgi:hypothetical protein